MRTELRSIGAIILAALVLSLAVFPVSVVGGLIALAAAGVALAHLIFLTLRR